MLNTLLKFLIMTMNAPVILKCEVIWTQTHNRAMFTGWIIFFYLVLYFNDKVIGGCKQYFWNFKIENFYIMNTKWSRTKHEGILKKEQQMGRMWSQPYLRSWNQLERYHWKLFHSWPKMESKYNNKMPWLIAPKACGMSRSSKSVMLAP